MLTLLGSVLGFGTSFLPKVMDYFQDKADKKHELEVMTRQAEIQLDRTAIDANIREVETIHEHDASLDGGGFVNGLRASVRPVITYIFMALFVGVEVTTYYLLIQNGVAPGDALVAAWDDQVMAMWASILAFWFGGRQFRK
mgnify:FL=1|jgi:hypothetical protein|tara:strand:+ start:212 stop:634 length:423 start_codon:yes stop_codon:yes gene_type:complete